jgi:hypothetical protein
MPQINSDNTITIPANIVKNMGGSPGDEIVFEEWLDPDGWILDPIEDTDTIEVSVMLRSEWERTLEDRAQPLKKPDRSEHDICSEIESRIGIDILFTDNCSVNSVFESVRWLEDREWMCGVRFALSQCFTDNKSRMILGQLDDIDFSSLDRRKPVSKIIEELFNQ